MSVDYIRLETWLRGQDLTVICQFSAFPISSSAVDYTHISRANAHARRIFCRAAHQMGMKVCNLSLTELDYWVARAFGIKPPPLIIGGICTVRMTPFQPHLPGIRAEQIIAAQNIVAYPIEDSDQWEAYVNQEGGNDLEATGPTREIAAMRALLMWYYGSEINEETAGAPE